MWVKLLAVYRILQQAGDDANIAFRDTFWLEGTRKKQHWQVLKIDRAEAAELNLVEDPVIYSEAECKCLLSRVAEGNKLTGGLQLVTKAEDIVVCMVAKSLRDPCEMIPRGLEGRNYWDPLRARFKICHPIWTR